MLHMVVITHGPETCAAAHPELGETARSSFGELENVASKHDAVVNGAWVDAPAHVIYLLLDAPNAHVVNEIMQDLKLFHWNTVDIHPVQNASEAMRLTAD